MRDRRVFGSMISFTVTTYNDITNNRVIAYCARGGDAIEVILIDPNGNEKESTFIDVVYGLNKQFLSAKK